VTVERPLEEALMQKVFIAWSGAHSKRIGETLKDWVHSVLHCATFVSSKDIEAGSLWRAELAQQLADTNVGILVLTPENKDSPWVLYEAGALGKDPKVSRVCPLLFGGLQPAHITGPLADLQMQPFSKEGVRATAAAINAALGEAALDGGLFDKTFDKWWPDLERDVMEAEKKSKGGVALQPPSDHELLIEILTAVRGITGMLAAGSIWEGRPTLRDYMLSAWRHEREPQWAPLARQRLSLLSEQLTEEEREALRKRLSLLSEQLTEEEREAVRKGLTSLAALVEGAPAQAGLLDFWLGLSPEQREAVRKLLKQAPGEPPGQEEEGEQEESGRAGRGKKAQ